MAVRRCDLEPVDPEGNGLPGTSFDGAFNTGEAIGRLFSSNPNATSATPQNFALVICVVAEPCPTLPEVADRSFGGAQSSFPWATAGPQRAMYAYDGASMATTKPIYIQHLRWRPGQTASAFGPVSYDVRIDLSTGAIANAAALSATFASNHGSNVRVAFDDVVTIPYVGPISNPNQFELSIQLNEPFLWIPQNGPLIVDIRSDGIVGGSNGLPFDGYSGAGVGRVVHRTNANAATADFGPQNYALALSLCGVGCNGQAVNYGAACAGSAGTPINTTIGLPTIPNATFGSRLRNGPPNQAAALWLGTAPLSFDLTGLGANNCFLLNTVDLASFSARTNASGQATVLTPVPNDPNLDGLQLYTQWIALDPAAPRPLGIVTSDGVRVKLCF